MLTIILVVGYFLFCVGMAFFLDYRTKKRKLNETAVEYSTGKNSMGLFMAFSLMCGNLISSSYIIGNSSAVIEHDIAYQWTFYGYIIGWALLFIIPGLIAAYRYQLTGYILAENPEMGANDAITRSKELMKGNKWRLFCLDFSFIGWDILSAFTLGIGDLWLTPYRSAAAAAFYRELVPLEKGEEPEEMQETQTEEDVISEE